MTKEFLIMEKKWILWRWKKDSKIYHESYIQEVRDKMLAFNNSNGWTNYPNWVDVNEIDISWIGDKS